MATAVAAAAQDTTHLKPMVCFYLFVFIVTIVLFFLGLLNTSKWRWAEAAAAAARDACNMSRDTGVFFLFRLFFITLILFLGPLNTSKQP